MRRTGKLCRDDRRHGIGQAPDDGVLLATQRLQPQRRLLQESEQQVIHFELAAGNGTQVAVPAIEHFRAQRLLEAANLGDRRAQLTVEDVALQEFDLDVAQQIADGECSCHVSCHLALSLARRGRWSQIHAPSARG